MRKRSARDVFAAPGQEAADIADLRLLQAVKQELHPCSLGYGPDYRRCSTVMSLQDSRMNLDSFFLEEGAVKKNFVRSAGRLGQLCAVIEVMGYYDGVGESIPGPAPMTSWDNETR